MGIFISVVIWKLFAVSVIPRNFLKETMMMGFAILSRRSELKLIAVGYKYEHK